MSAVCEVLKCSQHFNSFTVSCEMRILLHTLAVGEKTGAGKNL
jgi:hypothetical protein